MNYDVVIIGAGPAGLTAGIFAGRAGLKVLCIEKLVVGGQASLSYNISNFPGFPSIEGFDLSERFLQHAESARVKLSYETVEELKKNKSEFEIITKSNVYHARKVIIATGCKARLLQLENEQRLTGKGVSYCASCDGEFFKNKDVAVVGGGNSAVENVKYLSGVARKVYMLNRTEKFKADEHELKSIQNLKNLEIITSAKVTSIIGDDQLESIYIDNKGNEERLVVQGLFVAIGHIPDLHYVKLDLEVDKFGYIVVDENQKTNIDGLYACGDVTNGKFKQVITACADGARAANSCIKGV